jgi:hypothetical protein
MMLIDLNNEAAKAYRAEHRVTGEVGPARVIDVEEEPAEPPPTTAALEDQIRAYWGHTLREIVDQHGTIAAFYTLLQAGDKIESIHAKRLAADKSTGELISREYVSKHVLSILEKINQRLLTEMPIKLSYEIHGKCSTGASAEDVQESIKAAISRELKSAKRDTIRAIKNATTD